MQKHIILESSEMYK